MSQLFQVERGDAGPEQNVFLQSGPRPTNAWCWRLGILETIKSVESIDISDI